MTGGKHTKLLGRKLFHGEPMEQQCLSHIFEGDRVLVTGGAGYIGTMVASTALSQGAESVVILDLSETGIAVSMEAYTSLGVAESADHRIGDVRSPRIRDVVSECDSVIHCAAMKHVHICEANPHAAWETNVMGTDRVATACAELGKPFVLLSTDKATRPTSVMGATKRIAEAIARACGGGVVRLANVVGSTGSVIEAWERCLQSARPPIITDPEATRYYMDPFEAVWSIAQGLDAAEQGEATVVFNAGHPISTGELARRFVGSGVAMHRTELRPGEAKHEALYDEAEAPVPFIVRPQGVTCDEEMGVVNVSGTPLLWRLTKLDDGCVEYVGGLRKMHESRVSNEDFRVALLSAVAGKCDTMTKPGG